MILLFANTDTLFIFISISIIGGGQVCEMWGFSNGYGNNFDSMYVPFKCDDIGGSAYEGYFAYVFDHFTLRPVLYGAGQAPQFVLTKI